MALAPEGYKAARALRGNQLLKHVYAQEDLSYLWTTVGTRAFGQTDKWNCGSDGVTQKVSRSQLNSDLAKTSPRVEGVDEEAVPVSISLHIYFHGK